MNKKKQADQLNIEGIKDEIEKIKAIINSRKNKIDELEANNMKHKEENAILTKSIVDLQNQQTQMLIEHEKAKKTHLILDQNLENFSPYDIVIHIDSFHSINWKIEYKMNEENKMKYCSKDIPSQIVVGVLGRENVGKTYLMSKLSGVNLPTGHNLQTKGLSIKYSSKENIITTCLDSAGIHAPVYYFDEAVNQKYIKGDKKFESLDLNEKESKRLEMINDKKLTETFIEDFILNSANVILIVVGQLTQDDQTITERVKREYQFKKKIIIIHNFTFLTTEEAIKSRIKKDIEMAYDIEERLIPGTDLKYYCEKQESVNLNKELIAHFIYAHEESEIGKKINARTIRYIWEKITSINDREKFEIMLYLQPFFEKTFKKYFKININGEEERNGKLPEVNLFLESDTIKLKKEQSIELIPQNPTFTALGSMLINTLSDFDPVYELSEYEQNKLICKLEIPNLQKSGLEIDIERDNQFHLLVVKGVKGESLMNEKSLANNKLRIHSGDIKWGKFEKWIQLGNLIDVIEFDCDEENRAKLSYENGVLSIFMNRLNNKK